MSHKADVSSTGSIVAATAGSERYSIFRLVHADHKGELIHYVGTPLTIDQVEQQLPKNVVTHVWVEKQWKRVSRDDRQGPDEPESAIR